MKILLVNNYYYNRGGDCTYLFSLKKILIEKGHKVIVFSMNHPLNFDSEYSKYFVSYIDYEQEVKNKTLSSGIKVIKKAIYSREAKSKIEALIKAEKPDIAHIQNIHHHITPSIFFVFKKYNIPIVWTLHDFTLICPNTSFLAHGKICEKCKKSKLFWPSVTRCKKDSFGASTMAAIETSIHRSLKIRNMVDVFIAPSNFLRDKIIEYGFNSDKIICLNNFNCQIGSDEETPENTGFLYIGRLSQEKGIKTLIDATMKLFSNRNNISKNILAKKLRIVGDGPLREKMISYVKSNKMDHVIEFLGHKKHEEVLDLIKHCSFVILPSECYENFPYSVLEAFAYKKPVIGSRIGGIPELVKNWETGLLFKPGDSDELCLKIKFLLEHPDKTKALGENAKAFVEQNLIVESHYYKLYEIYKQELSKRDIYHV
jgi:glycosyltransferase involved in cell wall biosynthesis